MDNEIAVREKHRPLKEIDWKKVDELLIGGCLGTEIAGFFGICADTLYKRTEKEKGMTFSAYSQEKNSKGDAILRAHQYAKALGLTDKGDNTLLIWLGKTRLKQSEEKIIDTKQITAVDLENLQMMVDGYKAKLSKYESRETA